MARFLSRSGALALAIAVVASLSLAQQAPHAPKPAASAPPAADAGLQRRVEQIEEQLVDMQVTVGTLESLARGTAPLPSAAPPPVAALSATDVGRLDAVETQIQALAAQLENLQEQLRKLAARAPDALSADAPSPVAPQPGFGAVTVAPAAPKDALDRALAPAPPGGSGPGSAPLAAAAQPPAGLAEPDPQPQKLYERGYGYLLQKDYGAAEATFEDFLRRHPEHQLAGNAQYWLGETFYVRGQYRPAAAAFLKGYKSYTDSQKAPETLLKLAMSLHRLGQKDEACTSFNELAKKFPDPPAHVRSLSRAERKRSGC